MSELISFLSSELANEVSVITNRQHQASKRDFTCRNQEEGTIATVFTGIQDW